MKKILSTLVLSLMMAVVPVVKTVAMESPDYWVYLVLTSDSWITYNVQCKSDNGYDNSFSCYTGTSVYAVPHFMNNDVQLRTKYGSYQPSEGSNVKVLNGGDVLYSTFNGDLNGLSDDALLYTLNSTQPMAYVTPFNLKFDIKGNTIGAKWDAVSGAVSYHWQLMDASTLKVIDHGNVVTTNFEYWQEMYQPKELTLVVVALDDKQNPLSYDVQNEIFHPVNLGDITIRVQAAMGVGLNYSNMWLAVADHVDETINFGCYELEKKEDGWWEKTLTISSPYIQIRLSDVEVTKLSEAPANIYGATLSPSMVENGKACYQLKNASSGAYYLAYSNDCNAKDNDYRAKDVRVVGGAGKAVYTWTSVDKPSNYMVLVGYETYTVSEPEFTWFSNSKLVANTPDIVIYPVNKYGEYVGAETMVAGGEPVGASVYLPQNLKATDNKDNTFTLSWDAVSEAEYYVPAIKEPSLSWFKEKSGQKAEEYTTEVLDETGTWEFQVNAYDKNGVLMGQATSNFTISELYKLGKTNVRVLITKDSRFNTENGVWAYWTSDKNPSGTVVQGKQEGSTNWWNFEMADVEDNTFKVKLINDEDESKATQKTYNKPINKNTGCYIVEYATNYILLEVDCAAADHNYQPKDLKADVSAAGRAVLSWTTEQAAESDWYYEIYVHFDDGKSPSVVYLYPDKRGAANSVTLFSTEERHADLWRVSLNTGGEIIARSDDGAEFTVSGGVNPLSNLKVATTDNETFTFTWDDAANAGSYRVGLYGAETCLPDQMSYCDYTNTTTYKKTFRTLMNQYWKVTALDKNGNAIASAVGSQISVQPKDEYFVADLENKIEGMTVTFTWSGNGQKYRVKVNQDSGETLVFDNAKSPLKYTFKEAAWKYWTVELLESNSKGEDYVAAESTHSFYLFIPKEKYYTLTVLADEGGSVNTNVNGNYQEGTKVTIEATADKGKKFSEWSDHNEDNPRTITISKDLTLVAKFEDAKQYTLEVEIRPRNAGYVLINGKEADSYKDYEGTEVTVEAVANEGYLFTQWDNDETKEKITITLDKNVDLTAIFQEEDNAIELVSASEGKVMIDGQEIAVEVTQVTEISLYDALGRKMESVVSAEAHFTVGQAGLYIVRIGQKESVKVIIK